MLVLKCYFKAGNSFNLYGEHAFFIAQPPNSVYTINFSTLETITIEILVSNVHATNW